MSNTTGALNSFFGRGAGVFNITGRDNSFFGAAAGQGNAGDFNAFFGAFAGDKTTGGDNSFFGFRAGGSNTFGNGNVFFGELAGFSNTAGEFNTAIGFRADVVPGPIFNPTNATAIGAFAQVTNSNSLVLGGITGVNGGTNTNVGIGTTAPATRLHVVGTTGLIGNVGIGTLNPDRTLTVVSSLKWKTNVHPFRSGLDIIQRLRPISFNWRQDGRPDIGLGAEDVAKVAPSFTFTDDKGEVTGVKYERLSMLLINAVKEQQAQIQQQRELIERQQALANRQQQQLNALKKLACRSHRRAGVCR